MFFSFKVGLISPVNVLTIWFPSALFKISFLISRRSANCENFCFPIEVCMLFPGKVIPWHLLLEWVFMMKSFQSSVFSPGKRFEFPSEVWLSRCQSALFEADIAISSRNVACKKLVFPMKPEERCSIPVSVWFIYIRIMFLLSEVRTDNSAPCLVGFGFPSWVYFSKDVSSLAVLLQFVSNWIRGCMTILFTLDFWGLWALICAFILHEKTLSLQQE